MHDTIFAIQSELIWDPINEYILITHRRRIYSYIAPTLTHGQINEKSKRTRQQTHLKQIKRKEKKLVSLPRFITTRQTVRTIHFKAAADAYSKHVRIMTLLMSRRSRDFQKTSEPDRSSSSVTRTSVGWDLSNDSFSPVYFIFSFSFFFCFFPRGWITRQTFWGTSSHVIHFFLFACRTKTVQLEIIQPVCANLEQNWSRSTKS
jgi:hypothetical protein